MGVGELAAAILGKDGEEPKALAGRAGRRKPAVAGALTELHRASIHQVWRASAVSSATKAITSQASSFGELLAIASNFARLCKEAAACTA